MIDSDQGWSAAAGQQVGEWMRIDASEKIEISGVTV